MSSVCAVLFGIGLIAFSGIPAAMGPSKSRVGQWVTVILFLTGSVFGIFGTSNALLQITDPSLIIPWALPWGRFYIAIDRLSAFFLLLVFVVPAFASLYSLGYWKQTEHPENGRRLGTFFRTPDGFDGDGRNLAGLGSFFNCLGNYGIVRLVYFGCRE